MTKIGHLFFTDRVAAGIIAFFYLVGIAGHLYSATLPLMIYLTPWVLMIFGLYSFAVILAGADRRIIAWAFAAYLFTFAMEVLGVATGAVFGGYRYGGTLGLMLFEVPVVIGFNWMIIVLALSAEVFRRIRNPFAGTLLVGAGATFFDWVMEPAAIALDYWHWEGGDIPAQNYAAWFLIATLWAFIYRMLNLESGSRLGLRYVGIQLFFFIVLRAGGAAFP
jgi:uncharacterized membrane protein